MGREIILGIGFHLRQGKWIKVTSSKNEDTLVAPDDNRLLNDVYSEDELPDFCLGAKPRAPCRAAAAAASSQDDEPVVPTVPPTASSAFEDRLQQLFDKVDALQSDFATFRQQILNQQMELLVGQCRILGHFGYDPGSSSSPPPS